MADEPKPGDRVEWKTSQGRTRGTVKKRLTAPAKIKGHRVAASPENPEILVESEKTGARAAHKPGSLKKVEAKAPTARKPAASRSAKSSDVITRFRKLVNMTPAAIEKWLKTEESRAVGQKKGGRGESTGHRSGRRIVEILRTKRGEESADDLAHMRKVVSYIRRHSAQRPEGDVTSTPWRHSLMNWGHDPLK